MTAMHRQTRPEGAAGDTHIAVVKNDCLTGSVSALDNLIAETEAADPKTASLETQEQLRGLLQLVPKLWSATIASNPLELPCMELKSTTPLHA
jgi:hypothetical protein